MYFFGKTNSLNHAKHRLKNSTCNSSNVENNYIISVCMLIFIHFFQFVDLSRIKLFIRLKFCDIFNSVLFVFVSYFYFSFFYLNKNLYKNTFSRAKRKFFFE